MIVYRTGNSPVFLIQMVSENHTSMIENKLLTMRLVCVTIGIANNKHNIFHALTTTNAAALRGGLVGDESKVYWMYQRWMATYRIAL